MQNVNVVEEPVVAEALPIGSNEGDLEAVLLDGCLGFSLSVGTAVLYLLVTLTHASSAVVAGALGVYAALIVVLLLVVGRIFTDFLQSSAGRFLVRWTNMIAFVGAFIFTLFDVGVAAVTFGAVGLVNVFFLYGRFLAALARKALMLVIDALFIYIGLMSLVVSQTTHLYSVCILGVVTLIAVIVSGVFINRTDYPYAEFVSAADSKQRNIKVRGNNYTLFTLGFAFSIAILAFFVRIDPSAVVAALGMAVGLAGVLSALLRQVDERFYKESLKKTIALAVAACLMVIPIVPDVWKLVVVCVFTCAISLNIIVLINAVVETTRFNQISPIWLIGQEGAVFFAGTGLGALLFCVATWLESLGVPHIMYVSFTVAVVLCAFLQVKVNYQIYPFEPIIEEGMDEEVREQLEEEGRHRMAYRQKVEAVCERYRLSPREREVMRILLKGRDAKYIMDTFYISQSTAKTHIYNIYRKLDVHSRQELMDLVDDIELDDAPVAPEAVPPGQPASIAVASSQQEGGSRT